MKIGKTAIRMFYRLTQLPIQEIKRRTSCHFVIFSDESQQNKTSERLSGSSKLTY